MNDKPSSYVKLNPLKNPDVTAPSAGIQTSTQLCFQTKKPSKKKLRPLSLNWLCLFELSSLPIPMGGDR